MMRLNVICLFLIVSGFLSACQKTVPIQVPVPTSTLGPIAIPTVAMTVTHPELEVITPSNVQRIKQIDQWGKGNVNGVALSPDGTLVAVSTVTGIYLYDPKTASQTGYIDIRVGGGDDLETQTCPTSGNLAFSPDGSTLAIAYRDITLWDMAAGTLRSVIKNKIADRDSIISEIHFTSDGSRITGIQKTASGYPCYSGWGSLVMYAVKGGELPFRHDYARYEEGPGPIFFQDKGSVFISFPDTKGSTLLEVDLRSGHIRRTKQTPAISSMSGKAAVSFEWVSTGENGAGHLQSHILDLKSYKDLEVLDAMVEMIPNSDRMIIRDNQGLAVRTLDGRTICSYSTSAETINAFLPKTYSRDGALAMSWNSYGDRAGDLRIWDLEHCTISEPVVILPEIARQISISPDGRNILTGSAAGYTFHVFDARTGRFRFSLSGFDAAFSANGRRVFVVGGKAVDAYDVDTGAYLYPVVETASDYMTHITVSPDGHFILLTDSSIRNHHLYTLDDNSVLDRLPVTFTGTPYFSRDGRLLAVMNSTTATNEINIWDLHSGNELTQFRGRVPNAGYGTAFNLDFSQLATFDTNGYAKFVYLWNIPGYSLSKALTQAFPNEHRSLSEIQFVPGDQLFFARGDKPDALLFWNVETGELAADLPAALHASELGDPVAFSPDGRLMLILNGDGTIYVWGIK
jgi:WD40 repeat protein